MTKKQMEAEAAYAKSAYDRRAQLEHKAIEVLSALKPVTLRIDAADIELARQQARSKGLKYQTYMKSLLHQALAAGRKPRT
jgi:predicted DNA binding CopG/RHH family protein